MLNYYKYTIKLTKMKEKQLFDYNLYFQLI